MKASSQSGDVPANRMRKKPDRTHKFATGDLAFHESTGAIIFVLRDVQKFGVVTGVEVVIVWLDESTIVSEIGLYAVDGDRVIG